MLVVKVLKRKDASSLILGVTIAMFVMQFLTSVTMELSSRLAQWQWGKVSPEGGPGFYPSGSWRNTYLTALVALVVQLVALEVLVRVYVWIHNQFGKNW